MLKCNYLKCFISVTISTYGDSFYELFLYRKSIWAL
uniref:Uncharacterized protein n=1 Tax=Anguilla anguilla TaxID=7936 RepID=A0A0E9S818_ANGAN